MQTSNKLALFVLALFADSPGKSSWSVRLAFRLPLAIFTRCCLSFSSSFVSDVTSPTLNQPFFAHKCLWIIIADKVLVHGMVGLMDKPLTGAL